MTNPNPSPQAKGRVEPANQNLQDRLIKEMRLAGLAHHVGDDVGQLDVHLDQCLLHVLDMTRLALEQHGTLAPQRAQHVDVFDRSKGAAQQIVGHQLLQPLAIEHIGLSPRYALDVARIDQQHRESARLQ
jgi:hypothetical protein